MTLSYERFFRDATRDADKPEGRTPYPYQERFAASDPLRHLVRAPTGAGKTATAILGWLWRLMHGAMPTPRRLVYCLPMRVLVEQTAGEAAAWIGNLGLDIRVVKLMGGVESVDWHLYPERPTILVGTQDMLLSRALNRGYAASRFHWPIDFGLLNNDCLWVFDEPQLMGNGVSTSSQLAGLRTALGTFDQCPSVWMSATLEPAWLDTVDFAGRFPEAALELSGEDFDPERPLFRRMTAEKTLNAGGLAGASDGRDVARLICERHVRGTQTLAILNTVKRAKVVHLALKKEKGAPENVVLVHSRFRPDDRRALNAALTESAGDRVIIATQVVEAGVDISARTLVTELAPWSSVVQRLGRCNRTGDDGPGTVVWLDLDLEKQSAPYDATDLEFARARLKDLEDQDVSPKALDDFKRAKSISLPFVHAHVLRRRDLLDLFDTTPDLSGNDIDIQRFVRDDDPDTDVRIFWRNIPEGGPLPDEPRPNSCELCSVPVGEAKSFIRALPARKAGAAYVWDHLDGQWVKLSPEKIRPGMALLLPAVAGGYSQAGWDSSSLAPVRPEKIKRRVLEESVGSDFTTALGVALTIAEHTCHVCDELDKILNRLGELASAWREDLKNAARWHDVGKALPVAQKAYYDSQTPDPTRLLAKSGRRGSLNYEKYGGKYFRHELGSALAILQRRPDWPFVVAYLVGAHHGRVRMAIRALPGEEQAEDMSVRHALGIRDGDRLPEVEMGNGEKCASAELDLSTMQMGARNAWTACSLRLLAELGPFKLAYLEAVLRAADSRASREEAEHGRD